jgi:hypothetical protein
LAYSITAPTSLRIERKISGSANQRTSLLATNAQSDATIEPHHSAIFHNVYYSTGVASAFKQTI